MPINILSKFDRANISREEDYEGNLLVSIEAEDEQFERTPVQAILVIDVSGSMGWGGNTNFQTRGTMPSISTSPVFGGVLNTPARWAAPSPSGESKISVVKGTACKIVENLTSNDEIAIVTFRSSVEVILPLQKVENKETIYGLINSIQASGGTNFSGGIIEGLRSVNESFEGVKRLMVLTDGCPTGGLRDPQELINLMKDRDSTATASFFGFGTDCDNELLAAMAREGGGNHHFIDKVDEVRGVFARELGGLISCKAQNIAIKVAPRKGNEILEILNDYTVEDQEGVATIKAEDIYVGEKKQVLLKLKVSKPRGKAKDRPFSIAKIDVSFYDLDSKEERTISLNPKVKFVAAEEVDENPDSEVAKVSALLIAAKAQMEAVRLANRGDYEKAKVTYLGGIDQLRSAVSAGADIDDQMVASYSAEIKNFEKSAYNETSGSKIATSASGFTRGRAIGSNYMSASIGTNAAQDTMALNFVNEGEVKQTFKIDIPAAEVSPTEAKAKIGKVVSKFKKRSSRSDS